MQRLMILARSQAAGRRLRPLLYAAVTVAGIYYYFKKFGDGERTAECADTTLAEDPVQTQLSAVDVSLLDADLISDVDGVSLTQTDSDVPQESLSEAEEKNQKVEVSSALVDSKRSNLEDRLRELEELLCEAHRQCERKNKECKREEEAHSVLTLQCNNMKDHERMREAYNILKSQYEEELKWHDESLMECKREEESHSVLTLQCNNMKECEGQQEAHSVLKSQHEMVLTHTEELLKVSLAVAEKKFEQVFEFNAQLEKENLELMYHVHKLGGKVGKLEEMLYNADMTCGAIKQDHEQMSEAYNILKSQYEEELKWHDESLMERERERNTHNILRSECNQMKVSLAEAVEKYKQAMENNAQLEKENSDLMYQVNTLHSSVQQLKDELSQTHRKCDMITVVSLAEAVEKYKQAMENNPQLVNKNSDLMYQVNTLQGSVQQLKVELSQTHRKCDMITVESLSEAEEKNQKVEVSSAPVDSKRSNLEDRVRELEELLCEVHKQCERKNKECKREEEAHSVLTLQCNNMKVPLAEAVEKYKQEMGNNTQLEKENSDLMYQVNTLHSSVQQLKVELSQIHRKCDMISVESLSETEEKNQKVEVSSAPVDSKRSNLEDRVRELEELLCEAHRQCERKNKECKREEEAHSVLTLQCNNMKVSLAEAVEKYKQEMGNNTQLEKENSDLMYQVNTLHSSVQQLKVELSQIHRKCDMISVESLSETEEKNQKVEVSSAPVDSKRSNLEDRVRELEELLCEAHRQCERKNKECKREEEAHSVLTLQCNNMKARQPLICSAACCKTVLREVHRYVDQAQADHGLQYKKQHSLECEGQQEAHSVLKSQHEMVLTHTEESLKVSLAVAEKKCEQVFEFNAQLEKEKSELMYHVYKLGGKVGKLEEMLYNADMTCGAIKQDHERMREAYNILKSQYEEELKWHDEFLMERERERNTHNILRSECNQMKVSLAEAVEKYKQAMECNAQLENKNADLMYQTNTLQSSVQQLKDELSQTHRKCDMITVECEQEQEIYRMLLSQNDELKKLLNHNEELQKVTLAEAEKKYEQSMESISQLEKEKSVLMHQLYQIGGSVQLLEQT